MLDALYLLRLSWENVSAQTIANCFHHCGFQIPTTATEAQGPNMADGSCLLRHLGTGFEVPNEVSFETFVAVDSKVITTDTLTDEDIASIVQKKDTTVSVTCTDDDLPIPPPLPMPREAEKCLATFRQCFKSKKSVIGEEFYFFNAKLGKSISNDLICAYKRTKITDFMN